MPSALYLRVAGAVAAALVALAAIFLLSNDFGDPSAGGAAASPGEPKFGKAGRYASDVGSPGPGEEAPAIRLQSSHGSLFDLAEERGGNVLLYFQEGLMCQPCWDQLTAIEAEPEAFGALGIDRVVSITTDPADLVRQKVADEGISTPVLSDEDWSVSGAYRTNTDEHVMMQGMGGMHNGHSFILVGPDGRIRWRADYGGPPEFTMFVPVADLAADMRAGLRGGRGGVRGGP
ncbi:MAG: peroxiredoxin family protein [Solirubrobacterales bacterium]